MMTSRAFAGPVAACCVVILLASAAHAQENVLGAARRAASAGARADALRQLEQHLVNNPADVDARLLYGLVLSWEARYDEARVPLAQVLAEAPDYLDARVALMNVESWSNRHREAHVLANAVLTVDPGNAQARAVQQRSIAAARPWSLRFDVSHDRFSDDRSNWHEQTIALSRSTTVGAVVVRGSRAHRFSRSDEQIEFDFYPTFRPGTYAFVSVGVSPDHAVYAKHRFAGDLYQNIGKGIELSVGYRRLAFESITHIYAVSASKYLGNWMITAKAFRVPGAVRSTTTEASVRRYFGSDGSNFVGGGYSRGLARAEIQSAADLVNSRANIVRGQLDVAVTPAWRMLLNVSSAHERRPGRSFRQHTFSGGAAVRF